ncbi:MAG: preprotein translocase subunit YajC [Actinomycetales bacterium]|nr:preprotein translocase subunit YajC [Actinomycetales bacterium]
MDTTTLVMFALLAAVAYLLIIRPSMRRKREQAALEAALGPGATVMLASGFIVTVLDVIDDRVEVSLSPGVTAVAVKAAVVKILEPAARLVDDEADDAGTGAS